MVVFLCILLSGFYLRVKSVNETVVVQPLRADAGDYFRYAYNLLYKNTYSREAGNLKDLHSPVTPDSVRSPGYPLFLTFFVHGVSFQSFVEQVVLSQAILGSLTILLAYLLFKSFLPPAWALAACLLVAMSPHLIIPNSFVITETLFCFLLLVIGWGMSLFASKPSAILAWIPMLVYLLNTTGRQPKRKRSLFPFSQGTGMSVLSKPAPKSRGL